MSPSLTVGGIKNSSRALALRTLSDSNKPRINTAKSSVVLNIPEIRRVGILINGQPIDTLNGHMDLRLPLPPNIELIVGRVTLSPAADRSVRNA